MMPGYTGFIPGIQHEIGSTYGAATLKSAVEDLPANTHNPEKWKKFTEPFEQYKKRVPYESYHIPGYQGYVKGVKSENVYGKSYARTSFAIKHQQHATGARPGSAKERFKTTTHSDFVHPKQHERAVKKAPQQNQENQDPQNPTLIAERAHRKDPHAMKLDRQMEPGEYRIPGYTGFTPSVASENMHGLTYGNATRQSILSRTSSRMSPSSRPGSRFSSRPSSRPSSTATQYTEAAREYQLPGYSGFIPGVKADNLYAHTYSECTRLSKAVPHIRDELEREAKDPYPKRAAPEVLCDSRPHFREKELVPFKPIEKGGRNKSSGWMDERQHCGPELFSSTVNEQFRPPSAPPILSFGKCPTPTIINWPNQYPKYTAQ
jgi:hypothetical protein